MKERPILFNGAMVRAILDGSKTQTRRIVKPSKDRDMGCELEPCELAGEVNNGNYRNSPYGQSGDRLWVRENFQCHTGPYGESYTYAYRATDDERLGPWRPSIHMPREACRIILEITGVRVERLQNISEADAIAESIPEDGSLCPRCGYSGWVLEGGDPVECNAIGCGDGAVDEFRKLWISTGGDWHANPWVWVVEFRRVT